MGAWIFLTDGNDETGWFLAGIDPSSGDGIFEKEWRPLILAELKDKRFQTKEELNNAIQQALENAVWKGAMDALNS